MKRTSFIIAFAALVLSFGLSYGQAPVAGAISLDNVEGTFNWGATVGVGDTIMANTPINFNIRFDNDIGGAVIGHALGFRVYSTDGAVWTACTNIPHLNPYPASPTVVWTGWDMLWDNSFDINTYSNGYGTSGIGADTIGFSGSKKNATGATDGFNEIVFQISTSVAASQADKHLCIDSSWYRPSNNWLWSTDLGIGPLGDRTPAWTGPHCFLIYDVPNLAPVISNCPVSPTGDHCDLMSIPLSATDLDDPPSYPLSWYLDAGPGTITEGGGDNTSATWSYTPTLLDVPTGAQVTLHVEDALGMASADCIFTPNFTNQPPVFDGGCGETAVKTGGADPATIQMSADPVDCDPVTFNIGSIMPTPDGTMSIDANTGLITFNHTVLDAGIVYSVMVNVTDGVDAQVDPCLVYFDITAGAAIAVAIEGCDPLNIAFQGQHHMVDVIMLGSKFDIGGFDFLIAYDASALSFQTAIEGPDFYVPGCGWEYFTYRYGPDGNCGNACPSGMLRVVGIAETNNGDVHPTCGAPAGVLATPPVASTMFSLDFLVSNDRTLECSFVPIRFFWMDCGDNSISSFDGNTLYIESRVFDASFPDIDISTNPPDVPYVAYPTYLGAQADCFVGDPEKVPQRDIDFYNGGICIACADSIDARGDVNLNEIPYEIADAVVFSNYFVFGISAFNKNIEGQIAATDVNADGVALSVADLVYIIRVVVGDALPYDKLNPLHAGYSVGANGAISVDAEVGAAFVVAEGNVVPTLLADNMDMRYAFDGANTRILVYSMEAGNTFAGDFVIVNSNVVSVEMATYEGAPVVSKLELPDAYALHQNYPNPFNPSTVISFSLPQASDYTLTIYNVTGQEVASFAGTAEAGEHGVEWIVDGEASGIYFYKLDATDFSATKKMILLK